MAYTLEYTLNIDGETKVCLTSNEFVHLSDAPGLARMIGLLNNDHVTSVRVVEKIFLPVLTLKGD